MRIVKVNNKKLEISDNARGIDIQKTSLDAGINPIRKGAGGCLELRGYHDRSGAAFLVKDYQLPRVWIRADKKHYVFTSFSFTDVEMSNRIGSGRSSYFPARKGRMNQFQIRAAVDDTRIWPIHRVLKAPEIFRKLGSFNVGWLRDDSGTIIRNAPGRQFDNGLTLTEYQGNKLIGLMKEHAEDRRRMWADVEASREITKVKKSVPRKSTIDTVSNEDKKIKFSPKRGNFQPADVSKSIFPTGVEKIVIVRCKDLRVFFKVDKPDETSLTVNGVRVKLTRFTGKRKYWQGPISLDQYDAIRG